jgi:hypothetical protein
MFKNYRSIVAMLALTAVLAACKPERLKDYEPVVAGDVKSISGTWTGASVLQRDNDSERKNFPYKSMDITGTLDFTKVKITLQEANGQPTNFTVDQSAAAVPIFKFTSGKWIVDNASKVGLITLVNGTDSIKMVLGSYMLLQQNKMKLTRAKTLLGKDVVTYEFNFSK